MIVISARSPYQIIINEIGQTGSKVELFIWNKGTTEPTIPTYTMSESIASVTQTETNYNISPYVLEYINPINSIAVAGITNESNTDWCLVKVKRYKIVGTTVTLLNTFSYVGVNGFTEVSDGLNYDKTSGENYLLLSNSNLKNQWYSSATFYNFLVQRDALQWSVNYYNSVGTLLYSQIFLTSGATEYYNFKIPLVYTSSVKIQIVNDVDGIIYTINTEQLEECKYTPVNCSFVNSYGGWQNLVFFKAQSNSINIKGSEYSLLSKSVNYNPLQGQRKSFNINGMQTVKLNTGFVDENYNELILDLMMSETVLLNNIPVNVKTQSLTYKTHLKDKNINYEVEFEYANNLLNNIV